MNKLVRAIQAFLAITLLVTACGPSAKNEGQYWDNSKKAITELGTRWAGFKTLLDERLAKAEPLMEEAKKVGDGEKKAEAMKAANAALEPLLGRMSEVKSKSGGIEDAITKLNKLKLPKSQSQDRKDAVSSARIALEKVEGAMVAAKPENEEQALEIVGEQISDLISAKGAIDRVIKRLKPAKAKKEKKKK